MIECIVRFGSVIKLVPEKDIKIKYNDKNDFSFYYNNREITKIIKKYDNEKDIKEIKLYKAYNAVTLKNGWLFNVYHKNNNVFIIKEW